MAQVGLNNAFDFRSIDNLYFDESTKVEEETLGSPFLTPLIDGYRYNSFLDIIVNSQNEIVTISELQLGKYNFVKKDYFVRWKKKATTGYLIKIDETSFLRVQKVIREDYNPKLKNNSNKRYEEKISYFKKEDGKLIDSMIDKKYGETNTPVVEASWAEKEFWWNQSHDKKKNQTSLNQLALLYAGNTKEDVNGLLSTNLPSLSL